MTETLTEREQYALRLAVTYSLRQGLATDDIETAHCSNRSMVSLGRKLGCAIPEWCDADASEETR